MAIRYSIYTLTNPLNRAIFYVGCTNDLPTRLKEHISLANSGLPNQKDIVIQNILKSCCLPIIDEIEFHYDEKDAKKVEAYWIGQFIEWGFSLCNISHGIVKGKETRKGLKICLVCGIDFSGTNAAQTCSTKCRTRMSRMIADGKKPEFWLIAKSKGQKIPLFFQKPIKKVKDEKLDTDIDYKEPTKESYDGEPLSYLTMDEVGQTAVPMSKEQVAIEISKLNAQIEAIVKEKCPMNKHPKMFVLEQEIKKSELEDKISLLSTL